MDLLPQLGLVLLALVGTPLVFAWIPPNGLYGVRTRGTLASRGVWFTVNRWTGLALVLGAIIGLSWLHLAPGRLQVGPGAPTAIPILVVVCAAATAWIARRRVT